MGRRRLKDAWLLAIVAIGLLLTFVARSAWAQFPEFTTAVEVTDAGHRSGHVHHLMTNTVLSGDDIHFVYRDFTENPADPNIHADHEANGFVWVRTYNRISETFSSAIKVGSLAMSYHSNHEAPYAVRDGVGTVIMLENYLNDNPGTLTETVNSVFEDVAGSQQMVVPSGDPGPWGGMNVHRRLPDPEDPTTWGTEGPLRMRFEHSWGANAGVQNLCANNDKCVVDDDPWLCCDGFESGTCVFGLGTCGIKGRDLQHAYDPVAGVGYTVGSSNGISHRIQTKRRCIEGPNRDAVCSSDSDCETICRDVDDPLGCCTGLNTADPNTCPNFQTYQCDAGLDGRSLGSGQAAAFYRYVGDTATATNIDGPYFPFVGMQNYPGSVRPDLCPTSSVGAEAMDAKRSIAVEPLNGVPGKQLRLWMVVTRRNNMTDCDGVAYQVFNDHYLVYSDDGGFNWNSLDGLNSIDPNQSIGWYDTDYRVIVNDNDPLGPNRVQVGLDGTVYILANEWDGLDGTTIGDPGSPDPDRDYFAAFNVVDNDIVTKLYQCVAGDSACTQKGDVIKTTPNALLGLVRAVPIPVANGDVHVFGEPGAGIEYYTLPDGDSIWTGPFQGPDPTDDAGGTCDDYFWRPLFVRDYWNANIWHITAEQPCNGSTHDSRYWYFQMTTGADTRHIHPLNQGTVPL